MPIHSRLAAIIISFVLSCITSFAFANGHSVAVRTTDVAVDTTFEDRAGFKHQWSRVKVGLPGDYRKTMETRKGDATTNIPLANIKRLVFDGKKPDTEGYVKATVTFTDGSEETLDVKVQWQGKSIQLVGYLRGGHSDIVLTKCKYIQFSTTVGRSEGGDAASDDAEKH